MVQRLSFFQTQKAQKFACSELVDISKEETEKLGNEDWAILRLSQTTNRRPVEVDLGGIPKDTDLIAYPAFFYKNELNTSTEPITVKVAAQIRKTSCKSVMNSVVYNPDMSYMSPSSKEFAMLCDKRIIEGNSGSGVFHFGGKLLGVLYATPIDDSEHTFMGTKYTYDHDKVKMVIGSNAHCISYFNPSPELTCTLQWDFDFKRTISLFMPSFGFRVSEDEKQKYEDYLSLSSAFVEWEEHNPYWMHRFYQRSYSNSFSDTLRSFLAHLQSHEYRELFPMTPKCISQEKKDSEFLIDVPFYYYDYGKITVDSQLLLQTELQAALLRFKVVYHSRENHFVASLIENSSYTETFDSFFINLHAGRRNCMHYSSCELLHDDEKRSTEAINYLGSNKYLFYNHYVQYHNENDGKFELPICTN